MTEEYPLYRVKGNGDIEVVSDDLERLRARLVAAELVVEAAKRVDHWAASEAEQHDCLRELRARLAALPVALTVAGETHRTTEGK